MPVVDSEYIYLDYAATSPLCEEAASAMRAYLEPGRANLSCNANANSLHSAGRSAYQAMEAARKQVAACLGARMPAEVVFTAGGTEADNAAILGLAHAAADKLRLQGKGSVVPHVVTTAIEHEAVLQPARRLAAEGFRVTFLQPNRQGRIEPDALRSAIDADTVLVSVQAANSELGTVQPLAQLADAAHQVGALFHTDAVQAIGKIPFNVRDLGVDAASFAAHKVGGPKGVGALYLKARTPFQPYLIGGGQESGKRSSTQNVMGLAGFAAALQAAVSMQPQEMHRLRALRDSLYRRLPEIDKVRATVEVQPGSDDFLPNIAHVLVRGMESETLILQLDARGFGVSGGSACSSQSLEPSHVLTSVGVGADAAHGALRISMGRYTTQGDIDAFVRALADVVK